jgi:hypothetical protein
MFLAVQVVALLRDNINVDSVCIVHTALSFLRGLQYIEPSSVSLLLTSIPIIVSIIFFIACLFLALSP